MTDAIQNEPFMSSNIVFLSTVSQMFLVWKSNEWKVWLQDMNNFAVTRLIINIHTATFWRVWDEVYSHRMHTHSHRQLIQMQMRGEINANRSKGNKQGRHRKKRGRASLSQHRLLHWEEMGASIAGWMDGSVTASLLTLVELVQAAWAAERTERPRLQAAPALHPALCRPGLIPGSMKRSAATSHYIIMAKGWQGSKFLCSEFQRAQTRARWWADSTRAAEQCRSPPPLPSRSQSPAHLRRRWGDTLKQSRDRTQQSSS